MMICPMSWFLILKDTTLEGEGEAKGPLCSSGIESIFPMERRQMLKYNPGNQISYLCSIVVNLHKF